MFAKKSKINMNWRVFSLKNTPPLKLLLCVPCFISFYYFVDELYPISLREFQIGQSWVKEAAEARNTKSRSNYSVLELLLIICDWFQEQALRTLLLLYFRINIFVESYRNNFKKIIMLLLFFAKSNYMCPIHARPFFYKFQCC